MINEADFTKVVSSKKRSHSFDSWLEANLILNHDIAFSTLDEKHSMFIEFSLFNDFLVWWAKVNVKFLC